MAYIQPNDEAPSNAARGYETKADQKLRPGTATWDTPANDDTLVRRPLKTLADLRRMFDDYRSNTEVYRQQALIDIDFYDGKQFTVDERRALAERGQPDTYINRYRTAINGTLGVIIKSRADPRAWPRTPNDENSADVATDVLRYIADYNRFKSMKSDLFWDMLVPGTCAVITELEQKSKRVKWTQIRWEEFFIDPRSRRWDGKDARYMGIAKWMYAEDVAACYPEHAQDLDNAMSTGVPGIIDESFQDRPIYQGWLDRRNKRIMLVEVYYRIGDDWFRSCYYAGGILEEGPSYYRNEDGDLMNPIECCSAYMSRENERYGVGRDMRPIQEEINKRRSKLLHLLNTAQIQADDPAAIDVDADTARIEAARPDGVIPYGWKRVPLTDMTAGQTALLAEAKSELERFGPNPAILGRQGADASGRAVLARQQAGLTELAVIFDRFDDFELRCYRAAWNCVKQFWKDPMWIRVTDDENSPKFVSINEPITHTATGPDGQMIHTVLGYKNSMAELDVDIILDTEPETANIMSEMFRDLIQVISANPLYAQQVPFELLIELSPLPRKKMILDTLKAKQQSPEAQQGAQVKQQATSLQMAEQAAKVRRIESQTLVDQAKAHKLGIEGMSMGAETVNALGMSANPTPGSFSMQESGDAGP